MHPTERHSTSSRQPWPAPAMMKSRQVQTRHGVGPFWKRHVEQEVATTDVDSVDVGRDEGAGELLFLHLAGGQGRAA